MWLITTLIVAIGVTAISFAAPKKYQLNFLSLMLWGLGLMILVDHIIGYPGSGPFLEIDTNGLIGNGVVLGIVMLIPIFVIWGVSLMISKLKGESIETSVR